MSTVVMTDHIYSQLADAMDSNVSSSSNNTTTTLSPGFGQYPHTTNPRIINGSVVLILLILNLMGNGVVFYIYKFKLRRNVFSFFVTILAGLDLVNALTTMLIDVIIKMRPLDEDVLDLNVLCKMSHFQVYANSLTSGCVLTLIAYQRYRKICHPLKPALKMRVAKFALVIMTLVCILLSVPTLVIHGPQPVRVKIDHYEVTVTICRYDEHFEGTPLQQAFSYLLLSAFVVVLTLTVGFYILMAKALRKFEEINARMSASSPVAGNIDMINREQGFPEASAERQRQEHQRQSQARMSIMSTGAGYERVSIQMYKVFTIVTAVFIISYLPHLVVLILTKSLNLEHRLLTYTERVMLDFAYNSPYISTVANPIIYGFRNAEFREHCKHMITCRRWRRRRAYWQ